MTHKTYKHQIQSIKKCNENWLKDISRVQGSSQKKSHPWINNRKIDKFQNLFKDSEK